MNTYNWKGFDQDKKQVSGEILAETEDAANLILTTKNIEVLKIIKVDKKVAKDSKRNFKKNTRSVKKNKSNIKKSLTKNKKEKEFKAKKITIKELLMFTKQLYTMSRAGLDIITILELLEEQTENKNFQEVLKIITVDLNEGNTISEAFEKHSIVFDSIYINMLSAGEETGNLDFFIEKLYNQIKKMYTLNKTIKKALTYPMIMLSVTGIVMIILFIYVVPVFAQMYGGMGRALPGPTQTVINISEFFKDPARGGTLAFFIISFVVTHKVLMKKVFTYKYAAHQLFLKLPLFKDLIIKSTIAKSTLLMGNLIRANVPMEKSLIVARNSLDNEIMKDYFNNISNGVVEGSPLSIELVKQNAFPKTFTSMVKVGEEIGNMDEMLVSVSDYYEEEVNDVVEKLTGMIEPIMLVVIGGLVGFILIAMYMPIFNMGKNI